MKTCVINSRNNQSDKRSDSVSSPVEKTKSFVIGFECVCKLSSNKLLQRAVKVVP